MSLGSLTPSASFAALVDPDARRARAAEQARVLSAAVTASVVRGHVAYANASARVSVLEAEIAAIQARRAAPDRRP